MTATDTTERPAPSAAESSSGSLRDQVPWPLVGRLVAQLHAKGAGIETTRAPFTGEDLFSLPCASESDVDDAFARARVAQQAWAARPVAQRAAIIARVHHMALDRQNELLDLLQLEGGKSRYDAFQEVAAVAVYSRYNSRMAPKLLKKQRRRGVVPFATKAFELRHPVGVVGLVAAWNYPAVFSAADGFSAILAGNALVHRPDIQTALSATWVRSLAVEAGVPEDVWLVLLGPGRSIGTAIIDRADAVAFTGSTGAGRQIMARTGPRLIYTSLELGGKNPFVVLADADLDAAVEAARWACFVNAGQTCVGPERIIVARAVYDEFREKLVARIARMRVGSHLSFASEMGCLISDKQLATVARHVDDAVANGATVLTGGRPLPELGPYFYAPTVLEGVTADMDVCAEETFGPVVALYPFDSVDEAVELANDTEFGLHAVVWGRDTRLAESVAARIQAGTVEVNDGIVATWGSADVQQGGMKASGLGRRNGHYGILRFTESQSVVVQRVHGLHPPGSMGHETFAALMTHSFKAMHMLPRR